MIKKIVFSLIFVCLLLAISLKVFGVDSVHLGKPMLTFLKNCSDELQSFKISIPDIPEIPYFEVQTGILIVVNFFISVLNGLSALINFIILVANTIIQVLQFLFIVLKNVIVLRDTLISQA